jgi:hypothetical protein
LLAEKLIKIGKINLANAKFREYYSKFAFSPCKILFFEKKNLQKFGFFRNIFLPILPLESGLW